MGSHLGEIALRELGACMFLGTRDAFVSRKSILEIEAHVTSVYASGGTSGASYAMSATETGN
jgi:hypothetical protein